MSPEDPHISSAPKTESKPGKSDRRALVAVSVIGIILFLGLLTVLPTKFSPLFKSYDIPSSAMIPTLRVGSQAIGSRISYGYSRYSFDWIPLPIEGRIFASFPQRGDVVTFKLPRDPKIDYVKRIVGLPGDKVQMQAGRLYINGQMIAREPIAKIKAEDYYGKTAEVPTYRESLREGESHTIIEIAGDTGYLDNTGIFDVPSDQYFVLGDNRDNSTDSRVPPEQKGVGFVPFENLVGRIIFVF